MRAALYFSKLRWGEEKHEQREFQIHVWCVNRKRQTAVSSKQFLNLQLLRSTSTKKKKKNVRRHLELHKGQKYLILNAKCG